MRPEKTAGRSASAGGRMGRLLRAIRVADRSYCTTGISAFNRPIAEGGFWNPERNWYVYWREADNSIHGDNLVTPVNFAAVAYGLCVAGLPENSGFKLLRD